MSRKWNRRTLLAHLMDLLQNPSVALSKGRLRREHGLTSYDRNKDTDELIDIKITIDTRNCPVVTIIIHELLHLFLAGYIHVDKYFSEPLEEAMVKGLTDDLEAYLHDPKNERLLQQWIKAIEARLK